MEAFSKRWISERSCQCSPPVLLGRQRMSIGSKAIGSVQGRVHGRGGSGSREVRVPRRVSGPWTPPIFLFAFMPLQIGAEGRPLAFLPVSRRCLGICESRDECNPKSLRTDTSRLRLGGSRSLRADQVPITGAVRQGGARSPARAAIQRSVKNADAHAPPRWQSAVAESSGAIEISARWLEGRLACAWPEST